MIQFWEENIFKTKKETLLIPCLCLIAVFKQLNLTVTLSNHRLKLPDDLVFVYSPLDRVLPS